MDREELLAMIEAGPILIRMNDGRSYEVPSAKHILVSSMSAVVLHKGDDDKWRNITLPLVTMTGVEQAA